MDIFLMILRVHIRSRSSIIDMKTSRLHSALASFTPLRTSSPRTCFRFFSILSLRPGGSNVTASAVLLLFALFSSSSSPSLPLPRIMPEVLLSLACVSAGGCIGASCCVVPLSVGCTGTLSPMAGGTSPLFRLRRRSLSTNLARSSSPSAIAFSILSLQASECFLWPFPSSFAWHPGHPGTVCPYFSKTAAVILKSLFWRSSSLAGSSGSSPLFTPKSRPSVLPSLRGSLCCVSLGLGTSGVATISLMASRFHLSPTARGLTDLTFMAGPPLARTTRCSFDLSVKPTQVASCHLADSVLRFSFLWCLLGLASTCSPISNTFAVKFLW